MPAENSVEVHRLRKSVGRGEHGSFPSLTELNWLSNAAKETIALIGESGSGKSTLLAILAGLDDGSSGEVGLVEPLHQMDEGRGRSFALSMSVLFSILHAQQRAGKR